MEQFVAANPTHAVGLTTLGNLYLRDHAFERALEAYGQAQLIDPLLPEVHYLKGVAYRKLSDFDQAMEALRHALFLQPDLWCASFLLAGVLARLGRREQRVVQLQHTRALLEVGPRAAVFVSFVDGLRDVNLDPLQVKELCRQQLAECAGQR